MNGESLNPFNGFKKINTMGMMVIRANLWILIK